MKKFIIFILLASILTACSGGVIQEPVSVSSDIHLDDSASNSSTIDADHLPSELVLYPATMDNERLNGVQLLAEDTSNEIYLYGLFKSQEIEGGAKGVFVRKGDIIQEFDWSYSTPQQYPIKILYSDYDGDKKNELGIVLTTGAGPSTIIQELHILEFDDENEMTDHVLNVEEMRAAIVQELQYSIEAEENQLTFSISDQSITVNPPVQIENVFLPGDATALDPSVDTITFHLSDGQICLHLPLSVGYKDSVLLYPVATLETVLQYHEDQFLPLDYRFLSM